MDEFLGGIEETCCSEGNNHKKSSLPRNVPQLVSTEINGTGGEQNLTPDWPTSKSRSELSSLRSSTCKNTAEKSAASITCSDSSDAAAADCLLPALARQKFAYQHIVALSERLEKTEACDLVLCALFLLAKLPRRTISTLLKLTDSTAVAQLVININSSNNIFTYTTLK